MAARMARKKTPLAAERPVFPVAQLHAAKNVRILILDDDEATAQVMKAALARPGFQIRIVSDPDAVVRRLQTTAEDAYHLIILDYVLPGLEPEQVFGWIREFQPEAAVVVVTGYPSMDSALSCLRAHTNDYLTKPFEIAVLQRVVIRCLEELGALRMTEEALRVALGSVIRERRLQMKLTLAQLAPRTETSLGYLSQIELGKNSPSIEMLYRICLGLGMRLSELFEGVQKSR